MAISSPLCIVLTILTFCCISATPALVSNETECMALLHFKDRISDDPLGALSSWNSSTHFCQWTGVTCGRRHHRVTVLDLQSHNLAGSISPYIGNLSFLMQLHLQNNQLTEGIPSEVGRLRRLQSLALRNNSLVGGIPVNLTSCLNLININLDYNKLSGKIPSEIGSLVKLQVLSARFNNLIGNIPDSVGNLSSLVELNLAKNNLTGSIPYTIGQLKNLTFVSVTNNSLHTLFPSLLNLSSMEALGASSNQFNESLPSDLFTHFPQLRLFVIADNNFFGSIPLSLSNASNLESLQVAANSLTGKVPNLENLHKLQSFYAAGNYLGLGEVDDLNFIFSLTNATSLSLLDIGTNNFGGVLPEYISNLSTKLSYLTIQSNQIVGRVPTGIGNLINLQVLAMTTNRLSGSIPEEIGNLQQLGILYMGENEFTGNIPSTISNLKQLTHLYLRSNSLEGTIPPGLGNCTQLLLLMLGDNNISGNIPAQIFNISSLAIVLDLSRNQLTGPLPIEVGNLNSLGEFSLANNRLWGEIPSTLSKCVSLYLLEMMGNSLHGTIPSSLSSLRGLMFLDLSRNNFSGGVPKFLQDLVLLQNLNLSSNNFVGMVPLEGVFKNTSAFSVEGNNQLCGGIPELHLPVCSFNESTKNNILARKKKIIISSVLAFLGAVVVTASLLLFWSRKRRDQIAADLSENSLFQLSYRALFKATDGFSSSNLIGIGGFSSVYKGTLDEERVVAVKVFNLDRRGAFTSFMAECEALKNLRHRNLVKVITACSSIDISGNDFKALVYEFMVNGSLEEWLHPSPDSNDTARKLNLLQRLAIGIDVAGATNYLHHTNSQTPIVHCDLKPSNILLDEEMTAQVGDFGLVKFLSDGTNSHTSSLGIRGTIGYAAPEYGMGSQVSTEGDVYSYGILLLEMFSGKRPTDDMFNDGLNLHNYVKVALPEQVEEIADPVLLQETEASETENNHQKIIESLVLIFEIGLGCSEEVARERMDISDAAAKLLVIQNNLFDDGRQTIQPATDDHNQQVLMNPGLINMELDVSINSACADGYCR